MISLILLGAAYAIQGLQSAAVTEERPRAELSRLVDDALAVLAGLDTGNGTLLDMYLAQAIHCATDAVPDPSDCDDRRSQDLSIKLESYLPLGAGYAIGIGNGGAVREIYRSPYPQGESVSSSWTISPNWTLGFAYARLGCYPDADTALADVRLLPIERGAKAEVAQLKYANLTVGTAERAATPAPASAEWNESATYGAFLPGTMLWSPYGAHAHPHAGTHPAVTIGANVTGNGTFDGATNVTTCAHVEDTATLHAAVNATPFGTTTRDVNVSIGRPMAFVADLSALDALGAVSVTHANVTIYEPVSAHPTRADSWVVADRFTLTGPTGAMTGEWTPPADALYGAHVALLRAALDVGGVPVEARKALVVYVGLGTEGDGEVLVPVDAPYRITLQAWMPDWG